MDTGLFRVLNSLAGSSAAADVFIVFLASWLVGIEAALVIVFWWGDRARRTLAALSAVAAAVLAWAVNQGIGLALFRPRPFAALEGVRQLVEKSALDKSFPSDHAAIAAALAAAVWLVDRRWGWALAAAAALIGVGRVLAGLHYPSDVLSGWAVGALAAAVVHFLVHRFLRTRHLKHEKTP